MWAHGLLSLQRTWRNPLKCFTFELLLNSLVVSNGRFCLRLPPGPRGLLFLGVALQMKPEKVVERLQKWKDQFGDIYSFTLPAQHVVVASLFFKFLTNRQQWWKKMAKMKNLRGLFLQRWVAIIWWRRFCWSERTTLLEDPTASGSLFCTFGLFE